MTTHKPQLHEYIGPFVPLLAAFDLIAVLLGAWSAGLAANALKPGIIPWPPTQHHLVALALACVLAITLLSWLGAYRAWRGVSLWAELRLVMMAWFGAFLGLSVLALMTKAGMLFSRTWVFCWLALTLVLMAAGRVGIRLFLRSLRRKGFDVKHIILAGGGKLARMVASSLEANPWAGFKIVGYFDDRVETPINSNVAFLGTFAELGPYVESNRSEIDQVWIVMPLTAERVIERTLKQLRTSTVDIRFVPDMFAYQLLNYSVEEVAGIPVLNISYSPFSGPMRYLKDATDWTLALLIVLITMPLMLLIAVAIKLTSKGPVIFEQARHGWDGNLIMVYKFRTMYAQPDQDDKYQQATRNDPRITRLGRLLRHTSLDELPQFINVLQGRMSIVGPRPHPVPLNESYQDSVERYMLRHKVKPGITGWAQINGFRGETDTLAKMQKRVEYDLYYIENWSLWFDFKIILITIWRGFVNPNAY